MLEYLIPSSLYPCMKFMEACMFQLLFFYVLLEAMMLDICIRFLSGNKSVTSVTATFKEFTVIPTTRARTSQMSSTLVKVRLLWQQLPPQQLQKSSKFWPSISCNFSHYWTPKIPVYKVNQCKLSDKYFTAVFKDCKELKINGYINDGVYFIYPYLPIATSVRVYCDMTTDGGGWTVGFSLLILYHLSPTNIFILLI